MAAMHRLQTLRGQILAVSILLAALVGIAFVVLILAVRDTREAARAAERSERVATAANLLERLLLDLESGQRAYVITGRRSFLRPWEAALRRYPAAAEELRTLVVDDEQRRRVDRIHAEMDEYVREWSQPVVDAAAADRAEAARRVATGEGRERVDRLRRQFDQFVGRQHALSQERSAAADRSERRAVFLGLGGLGASVLLVFFFASYLVRSVIEPVEDVASAARRLREGDRTARATERTSTDEASALTRDFNTMADELAASLEETAGRRSQLEAVLDSAVEGIAMTDLEGRLVFSNERMETLWRELGMTSGGSIWERLVRLAQLTPDAESYGPAFAELAADPEAVLEDQFDVPSLLRAFHGYTGPVRGPSGAVVGRLFVLRETTRERAAEQAKEQFLATVSHELRTPLTSILGFTELVRDGAAGEVSSEQRRFLDVVGRNARHLNVLVDDLLLVGRAGEGELTLETADVDLGELARLAVEATDTDAGERRVAVELDAPEPVVLDADARRLTQLLHNLISNAIKFTPSGGRVTVRVGAGDGTARLEVEDTGPGIPEAEQEHLFERFYRAANASGSRVPGTGLGLAIVKAIVDAHGGAISVRSAPGEGTTFTVVLPGAESQG
jgi:two-component system, OmpR family, phosphate regulon sensor histidine kinase PhoR